MKSLYFLLSCLLLPFCCFAYERTLDVCAVFKNEARFLSEWIDFHRVVGVEEFWLYNNNSTDNYQEILEPYIKNGVVHLIEWPSVQEENDWFNYTFKVQSVAYENCIYSLKGKTKWLALIDIDEFIVPVISDDVTSILEGKFPDVSGICINWVMFGTSGIWEVGADEYMIDKLVCRAKIDHDRNFIYKSIVQPDHVVACDNPHFCTFKPFNFHVNTNREKVAPVLSHSVCINKLRIHHYWSKDEKFFNEQKLPMYFKWGISEETKQSLITEKDLHSVELDTEMKRFIPKLKKMKHGRYILED